MEGTSPKQRIRIQPLLSEPSLRLFLLGLLFVTAFCLRLYGIGKPPMDFVPVRQYHGALLARGLYEWLLSGNLKTLPPDGIIEPPILEFLASLSYLILGSEHLWIPRLFSALFWIVGGVFLYLTAKRIASPNAAVFSVLFYLFVPYSVLASRAFMPDPLMVMLLVIGIYTILRYHEQPSVRTLLVAAAASSLAVFVKTGICVFQLFGAFVSLAVYRRGIRRALLGSDLLLFGVLTIAPTALYYLYGTFVASFFQGQTEDKLVPGYVLVPRYWTGWLHSIETVVGYAAFAGALLGVLLRSGMARALLVGLWGGYLLFGLTFTYHIHTHEYYSLQLVPVVALSLGLLWEAIASSLRQTNVPYAKAAVVGLVLLAVVVGVLEHQRTILTTARGMQGADHQSRGGRNVFPADYEERARVYQEIGEAVHHSQRTIYSAPDFGYALSYHGRLDGVFWPTPSQWEFWRQNEGAPGPSRRAYFDDLYSEFSPQYFIVIKTIRAGAGQHKVQSWKEDELLRDISKDFRVAAQDNAYI